MGFEREVISIPAGGTIDLIYKYKVHAHPAKNGYNYKSALYYTFRRQGGFMERLFMLDGDTFLLNPTSLSDIVRIAISDEKKQRVLDYIRERNLGYGYEYPNLEYKFYLFGNVIDLPNRPKKSQNNHCYFTIKELYSGKEIIDSNNDDQQIIFRNNEHISADEIGSFSEGSVHQVVVNRYERDRQARKICLDYFGYNCSICGINFSTAYGEFAANIIHVHHLKPISEIGKEYEVDPLQDLRPVCPNCHTVIHSRNPVYELEELKSLIK